MKDNFLLKQLAQAVVDSRIRWQRELSYCAHCNNGMDSYFDCENVHKPHCIVLVAKQILKGNEDE